MRVLEERGLHTLRAKIIGRNLMEVEITPKEKKKKRSERSSDEDSQDEFEKPDWEEVSIAEFEKKHGV